MSIVQGTSDFRPSWFSVDRLNFRTVGNKDFSAQIDPNIDVVVIPETFLPLLPRLPHIKGCNLQSKYALSFRREAGLRAFVCP